MGGWLHLDKAGIHCSLARKSGRHWNSATSHGERKCVGLKIIGIIQIMPIIGPYDFRDAENADGISESSHKNGLYSLTRNVIGL